MNKDMNNYKNVLNEEANIYINTQEKIYLDNYTIAVNTSIISLFLFYALCLSFPINKFIVKVETGAEISWKILVTFSIIVFLWFMHKIYHSYMILYLNKVYAKNRFIKDGIYTTIGYLTCLVLSFCKLNSDLYGYITLIGILFTWPMLNTLIKKLLKLKSIKNNLD